MSYLDTSIVVPAYCDEALSDRVGELLAEIEDLTISDLTEVEFYSALSRKVRQRELTLDAALELASNFQMDLDANVYRRVRVEAVHYQIAREWIGQFDTVLRTLDALHLAVASDRQLPLVTGDVGLERSGRLLGLTVELISL